MFKKNIFFYLLIITISFASLEARAEECLEPKKTKKESIKKIQQRLLEQSKNIVIEGSALIEELGGAIVEGSTLPKELGVRVKEAGSGIKEVVLVLDEGTEGLLGGGDKLVLKTYSQKLTKLDEAIKKCKNDIDSYREKNKMASKQTVEGK